MRGHVTPSAQARTVGPSDAALGAELADGRRLARCLRCDTWIEHTHPVGAEIHFVTMPELADSPKPQRGAPLHEAIMMKAISINKGLHAVLFTVIAAILAGLNSRIGPLKTWAARVNEAISPVMDDTGQEASRSFVSRQLEHILSLKADTLRVLLAYRGAVETGEPPFGVYATVAVPGVVRVGDEVEVGPA